MNKLIANGTIWPIGIVVFFLILFSVNGSFLYLSITKRPAPVTDNPYRDGLAFQETIDARNVARADFLHEVTSSCVSGQCQIEVLLTPIQEAILPPTLALSLQKVGTAEEVLDFNLLATSETGKYVLSDSAIKKGLWLLEATFEHEDKKGLFREKVLLR